MRYSTQRLKLALGENKLKTFPIIITIILLLYSFFPITNALCENTAKIIHNQEIQNTIIQKTLTRKYIENNDKNNFWAIIVGSSPYNDSCGSNAIYESIYLKDILTSFSYMNYQIISLLDQNATKSNLLEALEYINNYDKPDDIVLIYLNGHGGKGYFCLKGENIQYNELDAELDKLDSSAIGIIISACHSGSAIPYLKQNGRVIITSCRENETSGGFSNYLSAGFLGFSDKKNDVGNNNGIISLEEAYNFIIKEYDWIWNDETPQLQDDYDGELELTFYNRGYDQIDQYHNRTRRYYTACLIGGGIQAAQSFIPKFEVLTKIQIEIFCDKESNLIYPLIVSIREDLNGEDLTSFEFPPLNVYNIHRYHLIDLPDVNVIPGKTYYIVCRTSNSENDFYIWSGGDKNCYDDGNYFKSFDNGETWYSDYDDKERDLFFITYGSSKINNAPTKPDIDGPESGIAGRSYKYELTASDSENDFIYYCIDWSDKYGETCIGPYSSYEIVNIDHVWHSKGEYTIKVKAKDEHGTASEWALLDVTMPRSIPIIYPRSQIILAIFLDKFLLF